MFNEFGYANLFQYFTCSVPVVLESLTVKGFVHLITSVTLCKEIHKINNKTSLPIKIYEHLSVVKIQFKKVKLPTIIIKYPQYKI